MTMVDEQIISMMEAQEITQKSKATLQTWRMGFYWRNGHERIYFYPDKRKLQGTYAKRVWWFPLRQVLEWNTNMNDRRGNWRRKHSKE